MIPDDVLIDIVTGAAASILDEPEEAVQRWCDTRHTAIAASAQDHAQATGFAPDTVVQIAALASDAWQFGQVWLDAHAKGITDSLIANALYAALIVYLTSPPRSQGPKPPLPPIDLTKDERQAVAEKIARRVVDLIQRRR